MWCENWDNLVAATSRERKLMFGDLYAEEPGRFWENVCYDFLVYEMVVV